MKIRQPYHLSWQLLIVAIIIAFIAFVEYWPHLSDDALMGSGIISGGLCVGALHMAHHATDTSKNHKKK
ncbi:hypothetical protein BVJ53_13735 [Lacticaseibacillus chiayiensis]|uniref:Uncharacterized protein n=1 Tax=Lacticaseibacillus chiayiensis TaxID=2100821 RepID=A0A4Q1THW8_9LACO|nr:hypothetical protein [Lacticaseibacillus chiayiensis]QVI35540.1 hypothetical protein KG086_04365 [Lacticaseibacillus chiayiensis]RXT18016.1 hypothetical protein BVJ53_13735 [Lacticaseibacillus chiayiensis]RXT58160.1 hypothetical protein CHT97_08135 [Lacticaseibacillus chiayiensis]UYN57379.1 hypothetical protein OFW50_04735 [Lacticaseibacillus chiayiensis]